MNSSKVTIIATATNRLTYVCDFIFTQVWRVPYEIISEAHEINSHPEQAVISYGTIQTENAIRIISAEALTDGTSLPVPHVEKEKGIIRLYPDGDSDMGFDIFSAIFYLLSRVEEYDAKDTDEHNRFLPQGSILFQTGVLRKPVIDYWIADLYKCLKTKFPNFTIDPEPYRFIPTVDIDNAYAYKHKGLLRTLASITKDLLQFNIKQLKERVNVLKSIEKDPYDTYGFIEDIEAKYQITTLFFWLVGKYSRYDTNLHVRNKAFRKLILQITNAHPIGLHPSYGSFQSDKTIEMEKQNLEKIAGTKIIQSRQHYLRFAIPTTFQRLIKAGIAEDYSLGYASEPGFRAGTCQPFNFYDITSESATSLKLYPLPVMEATLQQYMQCSAEEAIHIYKQLIQEIKKQNGVFVSLWHNESFSEKGKWQGWREVYQSMVKMAINKQ